MSGTRPRPVLPEISIDPAALASPLSEDDNRAAGEQIRDLPRLDVVGIESAERHVDPGEHGRVDVAPEPRRRLRRLAGFCHDERLAESRPRDALDEEPVHAAADAEREEIDVVQLSADVVEHVRFRLDVAVGHQDDAARHARVDAGCATARSSAARSRVPPPPFFCPMNCSARVRLGRVAGTDAGENVSEPSANTTMLNVSEGRSTFARSPISFFAVSSGKPFIDPDTSSTKMYSRGGTSSGCDDLRRLRHEQEEVLVPALIQQQAGGDLLAGQPVAKDEVAIARPSLGVGERHLRRARRRSSGRPADARATRAPGAARRSTPRPRGGTRCAAPRPGACTEP